MISYFPSCSLVEPSLEELFAEPIIQMIMQRDGVRVREMRRDLANKVPLRALYRQSVA